MWTEGVQGFTHCHIFSLLPRSCSITGRSGRSEVPLENDARGRGRGWRIPHGLFPLVNVYITNWKITIEIVDVPMNSMLDLSIFFQFVPGKRLPVEIHMILENLIPWETPLFFLDGDFLVARFDNPGGQMTSQIGSMCEELVFMKDNWLVSIGKWWFYMILIQYRASSAKLEDISWKSR